MSVRLKILRNAGKKALLLGASKVIIADLKREFIEKYVFKAIMANAIYEDRYLLGTALAGRLLQRNRLKLPKRGCQCCCPWCHRERQRPGKI